MTTRFMARAIKLAIENVREGAGGPFAAMVVHEGDVIGEGTNRVTSLNDPTAHAEVLAIRAACRMLETFQLDGCDLYTTCEPCPMCLGAIYWARLSRVFYGARAADASAAGFDDTFIYTQVALPAAERKIPFEEMMRTESLACFRAWAEQPNRVNY